VNGRATLPNSFLQAAAAPRAVKVAGEACR
jgi:hypothetical protein